MIKRIEWRKIVSGKTSYMDFERGVEAQIVANSFLNALLKMSYWFSVSYYIF